MGILKISIFFLGILFSAFANPGNGDDYCPANSFCGNSDLNNPPVKFPFKFLNQTRKECGFPGFDLGCDFAGKISLNLSNSGEFYVRDINYVTQEIQLSDPQGCLPGRLLKTGLNFSISSSSSSLFSGEYYSNYTFLGCPGDLDRSLFPVIGCLSNNSVSVMASSSPDFVAAAKSMCGVIATVAVPSSRRNPSNMFAIDDLFLSWKDPQCGVCEGKGGSCGFANAAAGGGEIVCTNPSPSNGWKWPGDKFFKVFAYSILLPAVIVPAVLIGVACCRCLLAREQRLNLFRANDNNNNVSNPQSLRFSETILSVTNNVKTGLDDAVIESYPKLILDENCSSLGVGNGGSKGDLICWICLDEYRAGETLRCLPNCKHYFHIECVDKWLKINGTCPVCRV